MRREAVLFLTLVTLACSAPSDKAGAHVAVPDTWHEPPLNAYHPQGA